MAAQVCSDVSEAIEICPIRRLYLKPIAKLTIQVSLPEIKVAGVSISNWEVMEKLKAMVAPDQFAVLRVVESTLEMIRFEAETETKGVLSKFIDKLDGNVIKLGGFADPLKVRAKETKLKFPTMHEWDSFFRDAKELNECKPGERPDTITIKGLPSKWFATQQSGDKPCENTVISVFQHFGKIRCIDIPILDSYRQQITNNKSEFQTFYFGSHLHFDVYIQFKQYQGFTSAMTSFKGMKLVHISEEGRAAAANIMVDFDRTSHLSAKNIEARDRERKRIIEKEKEEEERKRKEEEELERRKHQERMEIQRREAEKVKQMMDELRKKEERRRKREEKRRKKKEEQERLEQQRRQREQRIAEKRKRLEEQRKVESLHLLKELLKRVADKRAEEEEEKRKREKELDMLRQIEEKKRKLEEEERLKEEVEKQKKIKLEQQEKELRDKLLKNLKEMKERKQELERELLRKQIKNKVKLNSIIKK
ncbi:A-kinase anchor protein 17A [Nematostella vectensis]|uniref:A-kinase anchor protein 17A n=1 Tax=Nematostella vectensis TaxID=45351 RepID=UPI0020770681|nr:A-kinase anchor protein 17A [Nematostella vectensis]